MPADIDPLRIAALRVVLRIVERVAENKVPAGMGMVPRMLRVDFNILWFADSRHRVSEPAF